MNVVTHGPGDQTMPGRSQPRVLSVCARALPCRVLGTEQRRGELVCKHCGLPVSRDRSGAVLGDSELGRFDMSAVEDRDADGGGE